MGIRRIHNSILLMINVLRMARLFKRSRCTRKNDCRGSQSICLYSYQQLGGAGGERLKLELSVVDGRVLCRAIGRRGPSREQSFTQGIEIFVAADADDENWTENCQQYLQWTVISCRSSQIGIFVQVLDMGGVVKMLRQSVAYLYILVYWSLSTDI